MKGYNPKTIFSLFLLASLFFIFALSYNATNPKLSFADGVGEPPPPTIDTGGQCTAPNIRCPATGGVEGLAPACCSPTQACILDVNSNWQITGYRCGSGDGSDLGGNDAYERCPGNLILCPNETQCVEDVASCSDGGGDDDEGPGDDDEGPGGLEIIDVTQTLISCNPLPNHYACPSNNSVNGVCCDRGTNGVGYESCVLEPGTEDGWSCEVRIPNQKKCSSLQINHCTSQSRLFGKKCDPGFTCVCIRGDGTFGKKTRWCVPEGSGENWPLPGM